MILTVKIPFNLASRVVAYRGLHGDKQAYNTNRMIKAIDTFLILKALTQSGLLQDYKAQLGHILTATGTSKQTFLSRLQFLKTEGLLKLTHNNESICLVSWKILCEKFLIPNKNNFHYIQHDSSDKKKPLEYVIRAIEFDENKQAQLRAIEFQLQNNPEAHTQLTELILRHVPNVDAEKLKHIEIFAAALFWLQKKSFASWPKSTSEGSKYVYDLIHRYNACLHRSARGIRRAHQYKSCLSTTYLKRQLKIRGLADVLKPNSLTSTERQRKHKECFVSWQKDNKATTWHLPDAVSPIILKTA